MGEARLERPPAEMSANQGLGPAGRAWVAPSIGGSKQLLFNQGWGAVSIF